MVTEDTKMAVADAARLGSAWAAVGVSNWSDAASMVAFLFTVCLLIDWLWKRLARPILEQRGLLKRKRRRRSDTEDDGTTRGGL